MVIMVKKNLMRFRSYETITMEKTCCWQHDMSLMFKFSWEMLFFFFSGDAEVFLATRNKLFAINEKQI